jgi:hypothetical protein
VCEHFVRLIFAPISAIAALGPAGATAIATVLGAIITAAATITAVLIARRNP